jgi:hypothetical protein
MFTTAEFRKATIERVKLVDLEQGDIFSFSYPAVFVREVVLKTPKTLSYQIVSKDGFGRASSVSKYHDVVDHIYRVANTKEYDPKQQPYEDTDI